MAELKDLFVKLACKEVRTYIQSGNVVFEAPARGAGELELRIAEAIEQRFKLKVPVVLRTATELGRVAAGNPFLSSGADLERLYVAFLAQVPSAAAAKALDPKRSPPDELALVGRDIYLHLPNGAAKTKLTNDYFDRSLGTISTVRNWRTVQALLAMVA
jgi:uncharacterized protein (DUF1697 family)